MSTIDRTREGLVRPFPAVTLAELDARGDVLARLESKYILTADELADLLNGARSGFDVLEIDGRREFGYQTRYFDDEQRSCYHAHRQGRRRRWKVRARRYVETGTCCTEIKMRGSRGLTIKRRLPSPAECLDALDGAALEGVRAAHREFYGADIETRLLPALDVRYRRITLSARHEPTRITIDFDLACTAGDVTCRSGSGVLIVEVKSSLRRNCSRPLFSRLKRHPVKRLSKYCVGMAGTGSVARINRFKQVMRRLELGDHAAAVA